MRNILQLSYGWYDSGKDYYLLAPEGVTLGDFHALCDSLIPEAGRESLKYGGWSKEYGIDPEARFKEYGGTWIGWSDIVEKLAHLLVEKHGYERVQLPQVAYSGTEIMRSNDFYDEDDKKQALLIGQEVLQAIIDHNNMVEQTLDSRRKSTSEEEDDPSPFATQK
jgi:hypothetical protein